MLCPRVLEGLLTSRTRVCHACVRSCVRVRSGYVYVYVKVRCMFPSPSTGTIADGVGDEHFKGKYCRPDLLRIVTFILNPTPLLTPCLSSRDYKCEKTTVDRSRHPFTPRKGLPRSIEGPGVKGRDISPSLVLVLSRRIPVSTLGPDTTQTFSITVVPITDTPGPRRPSFRRPNSVDSRRGSGRQVIDTLGQ